MKLATSLLLGVSAATAAPTVRRSVVVTENDGTHVALGGSDDIVVASADDTVVQTFDGNDIIVSDGENTATWAGAGDDLVIQNGDNSEVGGGTGDDVIITNGDNNTVYGGNGEGSDVIVATGDNNTLYGGDDDDLIVSTGSETTAYGGAGNDEIHTGDGSDTINGGEGNDKVFAGAGDDTVVDTAGNDKYHGNQGDDTFVDGAGNDTYRGGKGNDTYIFDLSNANAGRMNRVFHFQHNDAKFLDEIHLTNVNPDDVEFVHKEFVKCRTDIRYTDPDTGKVRTVRVHSRFGCLDETDVHWDEGTLPSTRVVFTEIPNTACGAFGDYAYINYGNPLAVEADHYPGGNVVPNSTNPLRWLRADTAEEAVDQCSAVCNASSECVGFNVVREGIHSNNFGSDGPGATCYFRSNMNTTSRNPNRDCYRIIPEINLVQQNSRTDCVEGDTYGFTDDFSKFYVDDGCRGVFTFGDDPNQILAESWGFEYTELEYDESNTNGF